MALHNLSFRPMKKEPDQVTPNAFYTYRLDSGEDTVTCALDTPIQFRNEDYRINRVSKYADEHGVVVCELCESRPICTRCFAEMRGQEDETWCRPEVSHDYGDAR